MIKLTYETKHKRKATAKQALPLAEEQTETLAETVLSAGKGSRATGSSAPSSASGPPQHQVIKLGIDVHLDRYVVVRQIEGGAPQPPQRFSPAQFLDWAKKQTALAQQVYSCYEAGPFGYSLHRKLKRAADARETTMRRLVTKILTEYLGRKHGSRHLGSS